MWFISETCLKKEIETRLINITMIIRLLIDYIHNYNMFYERFNYQCSILNKIMLD